MITTLDIHTASVLARH